MWFLLVPFVLKEPCSRPGDPDIALQSNVPRCLLSPTSNEMPNSQLCPDIIGEFDVGHAELIYTSGAFSLIAKEASNYGTSKDQTRKIVKFKASSENSIYGRSNNVNVPSAYALIIIKE